MDNSSQSTTTTALTYTEYSQRPETYVIPAVFAVIFVVGVLGNGTLVLIFARHANMRSAPNTHIFSLALGDLLVILTCVPFTSTVYTVESWPYGEAVCKLSEAAKDVSVGVSVFTLTALSADRYFAVAAPVRRRAGGGLRALRLAAAVWILALLFAAPAAVNSFIRTFKVSDDFKLEVCYPFPEWLGPHYPVTVVTCKFLVYYLLPLAIITLFYSLMARHLLHSAAAIPGECRAHARQASARRKVAKTVLVFVVVFAVCFLPQQVFMLWFYYNPNVDADYNQFWHVFRMVGFCLSFANSCANPIALYCVSGAFRKYFDRSGRDNVTLVARKYLRCGRRKRANRRQGCHQTTAATTWSGRRGASSKSLESTALTLVHATPPPCS